LPHVIHKLEAASHQVTVEPEVMVLIDTVTGADGDSVTFQHAYIGEAVTLTEAQRNAALLEAFGPSKKAIKKDA
jgi:hypothetical protein